MKRLESKVIVIIGGTKGIGKAFSEYAATEGAFIVVSGRDEKSANELLDKIKKNGSDGIFVYTDLKNVGDCNKLFEEVIRKYGRIDGLFYYAGITSIGSLESCDEKTYDEIFDVNCKSAFFCCQSAIKFMKQNDGGSIVLTGSAHAWGGQYDRAAYAISKGALITLNDHISHHYSKYGIRCNYLVVGWTPTDGELNLRKSLGESSDELHKRAASIVPMGRMCEYNDYLETLTYLFSDESKMMTGSVLRITGGEYI